MMENINGFVHYILMFYNNKLRKNGLVCWVTKTKSNQGKKYVVKVYSLYANHTYYITDAFCRSCCDTCYEIDDYCYYDTKNGAEKLKARFLLEEQRL